MTKQEISALQRDWQVFFHVIASSSLLHVIITYYTLGILNVSSTNLFPLIVSLSSRTDLLCEVRWVESEISQLDPTADPKVTSLTAVCFQNTSPQ